MSGKLEKAKADNIKYIEYEDKYYDQMVKMYQENLPRTHSPKGYDYLTRPINDSGIFKVGIVLALIFAILYGILFWFLSLSVIIAIYIGLIHVYCFFIGERLFISTQVWYSNYIINRFFKRDTMKEYFSGQNRLFLAVDTEKDLLVGMTTYDTNFDNFLNLPESETGEVGRVSVRGSYEGRGIAKNIMTMVEEHAKKINRKFIFLSCLDSNKRGVYFYKKFGFEVQDKVFPRPFIFDVFGVQIMFMKKTIA